VPLQPAPRAPRCGPPFNEKGPSQVGRNGQGGRRGAGRGAGVAGPGQADPQQGGYAQGRSLRHSLMGGTNDQAGQAGLPHQGTSSAELGEGNIEKPVQKVLRAHQASPRSQSEL